MFSSWFEYKLLGGNNFQPDYDKAMQSTYFNSDEKLYFQQYRIAELKHSLKAAILVQ